MQADQSISFQLMRTKLTQIHRRSSQKDPAVVVASAGFTGGGQTNSGNVFVTLKPLGQRKLSAPTASSPGCAASSPRCRAPRCSCSRCRISASAAGRATRSTSTRCRPTISTSSTTGSPKITDALQNVPELTDVNSDSQQNGLETDLVIDRSTAARLGITVEPDRQHALRRLRPAPGLDDLQPAQPVSRRHGGGAAILAETRRR